MRKCFLYILILMFVSTDIVSASKPDIKLNVDYDDEDFTHNINTIVNISPGVGGNFSFYIDNYRYCFCPYDIDNKCTYISTDNLRRWMMAPTRHGNHTVKIVYDDGIPDDKVIVSRVIDFPYRSWEEESHEDIYGIPEFPTIAAPFAVILGLVLISRKKE